MILSTFRAPTLWELAELPLGPVENYKQDSRYKKIEFSMRKYECYGVIWG